VTRLEPFPSTFKNAQKKIVRVKNIFTWNVAMSDNNLGVYMKHHDEYKRFSGWNSVSPEGTIPVASTSLDQFSIVTGPL